MQYWRQLTAILLMHLSCACHAASLGKEKVLSNYGERLAFEVEVFELFNISPESIQLRVVPKKEHRFPNTDEDSVGAITFSLFTSAGIGWIQARTENIIRQGKIRLVIEMKAGGSTMMKMLELKPYGATKPVENSPETCNSRGKWVKCQATQ